MTRHVVGRAADVPPGGRLLATVAGREVVIFNLGGEFFGLSNRCPHQGGRLAEGTLCGLVEAAVPGEYRYSRPGEMVRCPWHGWEFDIRTGWSRAQPDRTKVRAYPVDIEPGETLLQAETVTVERDQDYLVVVI